MEYETFVLNQERKVTLTAIVQGVGGEFRGISDRPAVLVIPGGGYQFCSDREADPVASAYLRAQLRTIDTYLDLRIWIVGANRKLIIDTRSVIPEASGVEVEGLTETLLSNRFTEHVVIPDYITQESLCAVLPVSLNYRVQGYIVIFSSYQSVENTVNQYMDVINLASLFLYAILFVVFLILDLEHVVHGDDLHFLIIRHQKVEIDGICDSGCEDVVHSLLGDLVAAEIIENLSQFAFALNVVVSFLVDEHTADHIAEVVDAVVLERISQKVENLYHAAIGAGFVLLDVWGAHHLVLARELEDVAVHEENEHIAAELELELVLVLVGIEHRNILVVVCVIGLVEIVEILGAFLEKLQGFERDAEYVLLQLSFGNQQVTKRFVHI